MNLLKWSQDFHPMTEKYAIMTVEGFVTGFLSLAFALCGVMSPSLFEESSMVREGWIIH